MASLKFVNTITGEQFEFPTDTPEQIIEAYEQADGLEKAAKRAKEKARQLMLDRDLDDYEYNGKTVKIIHVQRRNYDIELMREIFDDDQFNTFIQPDKTAIDKYIKEYVTIQPEISQLRDNMVTIGEPYLQVKLQRN